MSSGTDYKNEQNNYFKYKMFVKLRVVIVLIFLSESTNGKQPIITRPGFGEFFLNPGERRERTAHSRRFHRFSKIIYQRNSIADHPPLTTLSFWWSEI